MQSKNEIMSVVIPFYNREDTLPRMLQSVVGQTYRPMHVILVDNRSTDASAQLCSDFQSKYSADNFNITLCSCNKAGANAARNVGLQAVTSKYVMFFDSDDELLPDAVTSYMLAFAENESVDIVTSDVQYVNDENNKVIPSPTRNVSMANMIYHSVLSTYRYAARTECVRGVGGWNEELRRWQDWELGVRLLSISPNVMQVHKVSAQVHIHSNSITGNSYSKDAEALDMAIGAVRATLKDNQQYMRKLLLRLTVLAGLYKKEKSPLAKELFNVIMKDKEMNAKMRIVFPILYVYTSLGFRGAAALGNFATV